MYNLDETDRILLKCLEKDGRMSYSHLAKEVSMTSTAVSQRIQRLSDDGVIEGFRVRVNKEKLGLSIQAMINLKLNFAKLDAFNEALKDFTEIEFGYRITGEDCIIMKVNLRDNAHLLAFINKISLYGVTKSSIIIEQLV